MQYPLPDDVFRCEDCNYPTHESKMTWCGHCGEGFCADCADPDIHECPESVSERLQNQERRTA